MDLLGLETMKYGPSKRGASPDGSSTLTYTCVAVFVQLRSAGLTTVDVGRAGRAEILYSSSRRALV